MAYIITIIIKKSLFVIKYYKTGVFLIMKMFKIISN